jgi:hypothetical protein
VQLQSMNLVVVFVLKSLWSNVSSLEQVGNLSKNCGQKQSSIAFTFKTKQKVSKKLFSSQFFAFRSFF